MTLELFIIMVTVGAIMCSLLTEAIKKAFQNAKKDASPNMLALIDAFCVGGIGTVVTYIFLGIPFTPINVICILLMILTIWVGAMIGFDKVKQLLEQMKGVGNVDI